MSTLADLRHGRTGHAALAAVASAFVPITLVAWISWQVIEGDGDTLPSSEFRRWAIVAICAAALTCASAGVFWRSRNVLAGAASGVILAGLAVLGGLMVDLVTSGGLP